MAPDDRDRHELVGTVRPDHLLDSGFHRRRRADDHRLALRRDVEGPGPVRRRLLGSRNRATEAPLTPELDRFGERLRFIIGLGTDHAGRDEHVGLGIAAVSVVLTSVGLRDRRTVGHGDEVGEGKRQPEVSSEGGGVRTRSEQENRRWFLDNRRGGHPTVEGAFLGQCVAEPPVELGHHRRVVLRRRRLPGL